MRTLKFGQESIDLLDAAAEVVREQQEKLRALNDKAKSLLRQWEDELQQIHNSSQKVMEKLSAMRALELFGTDNGADIQTAMLRQEEQELAQRSLWTTERLLALQRTMKRIAWLEEQTDIAVKYLYTKPDALSREGTPAAKLAQIRALQAQEGERERLAREIHDGPAQVLANAVFELEYCERLIQKDPARLAEELITLKRDVRDGLAEVRNFIFDLRRAPAPLAESGLAAMVRHYAETYQSRFKTRVETDLADIGHLPEEQETAIYRVVQEALQNVRKHSHASKVKVTLGRSEKSLRLSIEDDGEGFDMQEQQARQVGHFGLTSMKERSQLIGAELEVVSAPGKGTKVVLTVPLDPEREKQDASYR
ncbi:MAG: sensor histidine kinase [Chloroflexi bacterium]|nr:sensor histidine kinase [Chloroflexota bacterium]